MFIIIIICKCMPLFACHTKSPTLTMCKIIHHPQCTTFGCSFQLSASWGSAELGARNACVKSFGFITTKSWNINLSLLSCQSRSIAVCPSQPLVITLLNVLHIRIRLMIFHTLAHCFELFEDVNNKEGMRLGFVLFPSHLRVQINSRLSL